jgi:hypothetical protein
LLSGVLVGGVPTGISVTISLNCFERAIIFPDGDVGR